jgi:hypothetical protein
MKLLQRLSLALSLAALFACAPEARTGSSEPTRGVAESSDASTHLASWRQGPAKEAIRDFVAAVTDPGSPDFVPESERIATFDNDGTLWSEQPIYFQLLFDIDRVKALGWACWCITPMPSASGPTTAIPMSAGWREGWMRPTSGAGSSST